MTDEEMIALGLMAAPPMAAPPPQAANASGNVTGGGGVTGGMPDLSTLDPSVLALLGALMQQVRDPHISPYLHPSMPFSRLGTLTPPRISIRISILPCPSHALGPSHLPVSPSFHALLTLSLARRPDAAGGGPDPGMR